MSEAENRLKLQAKDKGEVHVRDKQEWIKLQNQADEVVQLATGQVRVHAYCKILHKTQNTQLHQVTSNLMQYRYTRTQTHPRTHVHVHVHARMH